MKTLIVALVLFLAGTTEGFHTHKAPVADCKYYYFELYYNSPEHQWASFSSVFQCDKKPSKVDYKYPYYIADSRLPEVAGPFDTFSQATEMRRERIQEAKDAKRELRSGLELKEYVCKCN